MLTFTEVTEYTHLHIVLHTHGNVDGWERIYHHCSMFYVTLTYFNDFNRID